MSFYSNVVYLKKSTLLKVHENEINLTKGVHGLRNEAGLDAAIDQPKATFGGEDLYPSIFMKASVLCFSIAEGQLFVDGNKRTALISALTFLDINGYRAIEREEFYDLIIGLAEKTATKEDLASAFEEYSEFNV